MGLSESRNFWATLRGVDFIHSWVGGMNKKECSSIHVPYLLHERGGTCFTYNGVCIIGKTKATSKLLDSWYSWDPLNYYITYIWVHNSNCHCKYVYIHVLCVERPHISIIYKMIRVKTSIPQYIFLGEDGCTINE